MCQCAMMDCGPGESQRQSFGDPFPDRPLLTLSLPDRSSPDYNHFAISSVLLTQIR